MKYEFGNNVTKKGVCLLTGKETNNMLIIKDDNENVINLVYVDEEEFNKLKDEDKEKIYKEYYESSMSILDILKKATQGEE